jgi:hypothetical protein
MSRRIMSQKTPPSSAQTRTRYGTAHPERAENELWETIIREGWSGYDVAQLAGIKPDERCQDFSHSSYRDTTPGPCWSWQRFGRTSTLLPDGRVIHIAGEHEDSYDPDFCIYNDVIVEHPEGAWEIHLYPKDVFPPTDFHSATLIGDEILLIGSLGYRDMRRVGETQVLKLDTRTLRVEAIAAAGEGPGWISRHTAETLGDTAILVIGGNVQTPSGYEPNTGVFELDLTTMTWHRREHGDAGIFPIPDEIYRTSRNPRYGTANPERSKNPFWIEMARRRWSPRRARLHFGDFAPPEPRPAPLSDLGAPPELGTPEREVWMARISEALQRSKLVRTIDDVIWTVVRDGAVNLALPDGRSLLIGGEVPDYGDDYADPWVYNDVVVSYPDGAIDILAYPEEVFPRFIGSIDGALHGDHVYVFGIVDRRRHPGRSRGPAVLRLDTRSYEITEPTVADPTAYVNIHAGSSRRDGSRIVFPVTRQGNSDPELGIAFDLETLVWSAPFPHPHAGD